MEGAGKGIFCRLLSKIFGEAYKLVQTNEDSLFPAFNNAFGKLPVVYNI